MEVEVKDSNNNTVEKIDLDDAIFSVFPKEAVLHEAVINFLANQRQGTHATKTRGLVSGGGKKPWRQKHTGRARAGSIRSPLWRGGGIIFGPQPRDYSYDLPKKLKRLALRMALSAKMSGREITIIDKFLTDKPKTKEIIGVLKNLELDKNSVLIVLPDKDEKVILSARNLPGVKVTRVLDLNAYEIMAYNKLLFTKDAAKRVSMKSEEAGA